MLLLLLELVEREESELAVCGRSDKPDPDPDEVVEVDVPGRFVFNEDDDDGDDCGEDVGCC